ncbi:hypothetical protein FGB62_104g027 [Gracilaria domingensis]|nr:hypothetical protein FGB62_104g027 [Gracilaria domingensis]
MEAIENLSLEELEELREAYEATLRAKRHQLEYITTQIEVTRNGQQRPRGANGANAANNGDNALQELEAQQALIESEKVALEGKLRRVRTRIDLIEAGLADFKRTDNPSLGLSQLARNE